MNKIIKSIYSFIQPTVVKIFDNRRIGNTTRLADYYVQKLFTWGTTGEILDHCDSRKMNEKLFKIILKRLSIEHRGIYPNLTILYNQRVIRLPEEWNYQNSKEKK